MQSNLLKFIFLLSTLNTMLFSATPIPLPVPIIEPICPNNYKPVCGSAVVSELQEEKLRTFANQCKLEHTTYPHTFKYQYDGECTVKNAYNHTDKILTCDKYPSTTTAHDIHMNDLNTKLDTLYPAYTHILSHNDVQTFPSDVEFNPLSLMFIDSEGELKHSVTIEGKGTWFSDINLIGFVPDMSNSNESNITSSIQYVINNNCDYNKSVSKPANISINMSYTTPYLGFGIGQCFSQLRTVDAIDDAVLLEKNEHIKVISVLDNDDNYASATHFLFASLRLLDKEQTIKRKIHIENEGTWLADTNAGQVVFVPEKNFKGSSEVSYTIHSKCSYQYEPNRYPDASRAKIKITKATPTPTPTPVPCPKVKNLVCGEENLCLTNVTGETTCLPTIARKKTYQNTCELFKAGDVFLYEGECHRATPTPTPTVTPTATPSPTPTPKPIQKTELKVVTLTTAEPTNTTKTISKDDGSASSTLSMLLTGSLTLLIGILTMRREEL
ncbi:MAG: hypothetical protein U9N11_06660 [Campylobacterota bacterium]|nr:hypothetical protein [Campylobacterota bacterium]